MAGTLTSGALLSGAVGSVAQAQASCLSISGFDFGKGCKSAPLSIAIGLGPNAKATARTPLSVAFASGPTDKASGHDPIGDFVNAVRHAFSGVPLGAHPRTAGRDKKNPDGAGKTPDQTPSAPTVDERRAAAESAAYAAERAKQKADEAAAAAKKSADDYAAKKKEADTASAAPNATSDTTARQEARTKRANAALAQYDMVQTKKKADDAAAAAKLAEEDAAQKKKLAEQATSTTSATVAMAATRPAREMRTSRTAETAAEAPSPANAPDADRAVADTHERPGPDGGAGYWPKSQDGSAREDRTDDTAAGRDLPSVGSPAAR